MNLPRTAGLLVDKARSFACGLYKQVPGALIPNAGEDGLRFVWDSICNPPDNPQDPPLPGLPPPPGLPFTGGQCPKQYQVDIIVKQNTGNVTGVTVYCRGPISGFKWRWDGTFWNIDLAAYTNTGEYKRQDYYVFGARPNAYPGMYAVITKISVVNGTADNCGNPPDAYPFPTHPPTGGYTKNEDITLNDNDTTNITLSLPPIVLPIPLGKFPSVVVNVDTPTLKVPIEFNFDGTVNIGKGGDGGGFTDTDRDNLNTVNNTTNNTNNEFNNFKNDYYKNINNRRNKKRDPESFEPPVTDRPPGSHSREYLAAVQINLTSVPANAKSQSGVQAPDVYYAGWFEWRRNGFSSPREPIHFKESVFLAPEGVDGYAYTLYTGYSGSATEIINKEEVP